MSGLRAHLLDEVHHWQGVHDDALPIGSSAGNEVTNAVHIPRQAEVKVDIQGICSDSTKAPYQTFSPPKYGEFDRRCISHENSVFFQE